jgi:hypothetical protein
MPISHGILPDVQAKPGLDFDHLRWAGEYFADKRPDTLVCIGDFADMPSLSQYDVGRKAFEGRTYRADIEASLEAMETFLAPIERERARRLTGKRKQWNPRMILTLGNHEQRINTAIELDRKLDGLISVDDLKYREFGWEVYPFLEVVMADEIAYSHYFCSGVMGRPVSSARTLVSKKHQSCVMGHVQTTEISMTERRADGTPLIGLFAGCYYAHDEGYLNPQTNQCHRQIWYNTQVANGGYYPMGVSIEFLREKYS